jgi:diacylglycerol kinase (ATP)
LGLPALVVVNPAAAGGRASRAWKRLEPLVRARFPALAVRQTGGPGEAERLAREWGLENPAGALIAAGGDGTVHEAVNGLCAGEWTGQLGVIPMGSGNDFARNAAIPLDPVQAARGLAAGSSRRCDVGRLVFQNPGGRAQTRVFVNSVSLGVSVRANRLAHAIASVGPGPRRYRLGALLALLSSEDARYRLTGASGPFFDGPALNLTVANGAAFGGGLRISPDSSPLDGRLELVILGPMGRLRAILALSRLQQGRHVDMAEVRVVALPGSIGIALAQDAWCAEADGEQLEGRGVLTVDLLPGRLALLN